MSFFDPLVSKIRYSQTLSIIKGLEKKKGELRILDAGGGDGGFTAILLERGHDVVVCDKASGAFRCDLEAPLPFKDGEFDLVVCLAVVEHLYNWEGALREFKRVGQHVIITTPAPSGKPVLNFLAKHNLVNRGHIEDHKYYLSKEDIERQGYSHAYFLLGLNQLGSFNIEASTPSSPWGLIALFLLSLVISLTPPSDDLLRHLVAYMYDFDYSKLYINSYMPSYDFYIAFDWLAGWVHRAMGYYSFLPFQLLATLLFAAGYLISTRGTPPNIRCTFLILLLFALRGRIILGRPAVLMAGAFFILWAADGRLSRWVKVTASTFLAPFYWLFFIYLIPLVMKDRIYLLSLALGIGFWLVYAGGGYWDSIHHLLSAIGSRDIPVGENASIMAIFAFAFMLIPLAMHFKRDLRSLFAIGFFALSNQIRYVDVILSLASGYARFFKRDIPGIVPACLVPLLVFAPTGKHLQDFSSLKGEVVLCDNLGTMFEVVYTACPVKISPSMEIGWTTKDVQTLMQGVQKSQVDARAIQKQGYGVLVEKSLSLDHTPRGLDLRGIKGEYRVWEVSGAAGGDL